MMRVPETHAPTKDSGGPRAIGPLLQRQCACGGSTAGECEECRAGEATLERSPMAPAPPAVPSIVYDVLRRHGQPLDAATREYFEPRFGHAFDRVRIHADDAAGRAASAG